MKHFVNSLEEAINTYKLGTVVIYKGERYRLETVCAIVNLDTNEALIRGLNF